jgi:Raf kinase inhibitor-like YbhB/YbcL family protein
MNKPLVLRSPAFENGGFIPKKYSGEGDEINPPLHIEGLPPNTQSLALILVDLSIPMGLGTHWVVWNIPPTDHIDEDTKAGVLGKNGFGRHAYLGPKPPFGTHKYRFKIYALDAMLTLDANKGRKDLEKALEGHLLAEAELVGLYRKS